MHLAAERLAEGVDGGLSAGEREHVAGCAACTRELEAARRLLALAADERRRIAPPLTDWSSLSARLRVDGSLVPSAAAPTRAAAVRWRRVAVRAAAAVALLGGGVALGRVTAPAVATPRVPVARAEATFGSPDDARAALERAQQDYDLAANWLAVHDVAPDADPDQYRTRLAALDRTAETMQQAMRDAPADPFLNGYYRATLSAREQTLRRLGTVLPVGSRLGGF